jgi:hypothetical protein
MLSVINLNAAILSVAAPFKSAVVCFLHLEDEKKNSENFVATKSAEK